MAVWYWIAFKDINPNPFTLSLSKRSH